MNNLVLCNELASPQQNGLLPIINRVQQTYGVLNISLCQCGALTFEFPDGDVSVLASNAHKYFLCATQQDFFLISQKLIPNYSNCNHCVNHWGLDLCRCGSGESVEECTNDLSECGQASQRLEDYL